jgi:serine/threonine protein kinase/tetratricopeptide (TPR) repeat protein
MVQAPGDDLFFAWQQELKPGDRVGRFEVRREIGRGGFGTVYEAHDGELGRSVALKALRPRRTGQELSTDWIKREAEAIAKLDHANIVTLFDVGRCPSGPYLVMELLHGETLAERLESGPLQLEDGLRIAEEIARGLAHAHQRGVLHRDLKPANVFLTEDRRVKLLDFARAHVGGRAGDSSGGTPAYMAPEQARGGTVDERSDVYAAAMVLREMLTGKRPTDPATTPQTSKQGADSWGEKAGPRTPPDVPAAPAPEANDVGPPKLPGLPRAIARVVDCALAEAPSKRPRDGAAWLEVLQSARRSIERPRTVRRVALFATVFLVLGLVIAGIATWRVWRMQLLEDPDGRTSVAVADFANQTGDSDLDGLSGLLTAALEQSKMLRVLTRSRMWDQLRAMGKERVERIDEPLAREIGKRAGVRALLLASIRRIDGLYTVEMRAFDPRRDEYLFTVSEQTSEKKGVLSLIDRLSERTRSELRERSEEIRSSAPRTADVVTPNLEAHRHYFLGLDCMERPSIHPGHPESCLAEFQQAVALDPGFALAHYEISRVGLYEFTPSEADRAAAAMAVRLADRLPRKERMLVLAWDAHLQGRDEDSRARYREVVAAFPKDKRALYLAGDLAFHRDDLLEAAGYFARVLDLDPTFEFALDHLSYSLAVLGRREDLAARVKAWSSMAQTPALQHALVQAWIGLGDGAAAVAAARREMEGTEGGLALPDLARALAFTGDYQALEASLPAGAEQMPLGTAFWLAHARAAQGRRTAGLAVLDQLERRPGERDFLASVHFVRALHFAGDRDAPRVWAEARALRADDPRMAGSLAVQLARLGDMGHARELAATLEPGTSSHELYLALVEAQEGHGAQARARLRALEARNPQPRGGIAPAFLRGELAATEGIDAEAVEALRSFQGLYPLGHWRSWAWPRSLLLVARSLDRLGRREEARAELDRLLGLWRSADAGLPSLAEARALRAQLDTGGGPAKEVR